jgi:hypothetical protein
MLFQTNNQIKFSTRKLLLQLHQYCIQSLATMDGDVFKFYSIGFKTLPPSCALRRCPLIQFPKGDSFNLLHQVLCNSEEHIWSSFPVPYTRVYYS